MPGVRQYQRLNKSLRIIAIPAKGHPPGSMPPNQMVSHRLDCAGRTFGGVWASPAWGTLSLSFLLFLSGSLKGLVWGPVGEGCEEPSESAAKVFLQQLRLRR